MVRVKFRYFVVNVTRGSDNTPAKVDPEILIRLIFRELSKLHGNFGMAAIQSGGVNVKYVSATTGIAMIKLRRGPHRLLASALPLIKEDFKNIAIRIGTLYVGATIKQCLLFIKHHQMAEYDKVAASVAVQRRAELKNKYMENICSQISQIKE